MYKILRWLNFRRQRVHIHDKNFPNYNYSNLHAVLNGSKTHSSQMSTTTVYNAHRKANADKAQSSKPLHKPIGVCVVIQP